MPTATELKPKLKVQWLNGTKFGPTDEVVMASGLTLHAPNGPGAPGRVVPEPDYLILKVREVQRMRDSALSAEADATAARAELATARARLLEVEAQSERYRADAAQCEMRMNAAMAALGIVLVVVVAVMAWGIK